MSNSNASPRAKIVGIAIFGLLMAVSTTSAFKMHGEANAAKRQADARRAQIEGARRAQEAAARAQGDAMRNIDFSRMATGY